MKAIWNGKVIAESNNTIVIDGNHYFPPMDVNKEYFNYSDYKATCPWKGQASYYTLSVSGQMNIDAAWYYPIPNDKVKNIKDYIAFWKGVEIIE